MSQYTKNYIVCVFFMSLAWTLTLATPIKSKFNPIGIGKSEEEWKFKLIKMTHIIVESIIFGVYLRWSETLDTGWIARTVLVVVRINYQILKVSERLVSQPRGWKSLSWLITVPTPNFICHWPSGEWVRRGIIKLTWLNIFPMTFKPYLNLVEIEFCRDSV